MTVIAYPDRVESRTESDQDVSQTVARSSRYKDL
jgi:hypothetical protein